MESLQDYTKDSDSQSPLDPSLFSPLVAHTLKFQGQLSHSYDAICYDEKLRMIIVCPPSKPIQFYDATTFEPCEKREIPQLKGLVTSIAFQPENDAFLFGYSSGTISKYDISKDSLKTLKELQGFVLPIAFLAENFYAFSLDMRKKLFVGNLDNEEVTCFDLHHNDLASLYHSTERNLLFSGLSNGSVRIYRTNKLPSLGLISSIQAHQAGKEVLKIQNFVVNGKEYVVTISRETWNVRIWHFVKGRMRLLKVIPVTPSSLVYLKDYKMIVIADETNSVKFLRFPSMKLEKTVELMNSGRHYVFLMEEKNMIGVAHAREETIEVIQLHPKLSVWREED